MSTPGSTLLGCENVQDELNKYFLSPACDPAVMGFPSPFNEFLWSDLNRSDLQQQINPKNGKLRTVILRYDQALAPAERKSYSEVTCTSENERGDLSASYEMDPDDIVEENELFDEDSWFATCRSNPEIILRKIALLMKSVREGTYKKTADEFVTGAMWGKWGQFAEQSYNVNGLDELEVKTKKDASDDIFPTSMQAIKNALNMTGYCLPPFITGGNALFEYWQLMQAGCCANQGIDLGEIMRQFGVAVTWDKYLQQTSAFNDVNMSVAIQPRALQLIYFNRYAGKAEIDAALGKRNSTYDKFVINDPVSGMPMNVLISDNCPSGISISIHTNTKLVSLPYDIFGTGDDLEGVTWVNKIKVLNV